MKIGDGHDERWTIATEIELAPHANGTDGFFVAIFERQPCPTAS